jgi:UDP-N-acetylglucosamine 2-epimerase
VLIGNSSAGIIEAASLGVPVVNIGQRQAGRERNGNVLDAAPNAAALRAALQRALSDHGFLQQVAKRKNIYGDGHAAERIVSMLRRIHPDHAERAKRFADIRFSENIAAGRDFQSPD